MWPILNVLKSKSVYEWGQLFLLSRYVGVAQSLHRVGHDWSDLAAAAADMYPGLPQTIGNRNEI